MKIRIGDVVEKAAEAAKAEVRTYVQRGPFRTPEDKNEYREEQSKAMAELDAAIADVSIGAVEGAQLLIEGALRHVQAMRAIVQKGRE